MILSSWSGVLAILSGRPAYGYEITAWLRDQGFSDIAEGTVYALLVRVEQRGLVDVEWTLTFLAERLEQLRKEGDK